MEKKQPWEPLEIEKAITWLYRTVGMKSATSQTHDEISMATFMMKDFEEEKRRLYVRELQERIHSLEETLNERRRNGLIEMIEDMRKDFKTQLPTHSKNGARIIRHEDPESIYIGQHSMTDGWNACLDELKERLTYHP